MEQEEEQCGDSRFRGILGRVLETFNPCYACRSCRPQLNRASSLICWGMGRSEGIRELTKELSGTSEH